MIEVRHVCVAGFIVFIAWGLAAPLFPVLRWLGHAFTLGLLTAFTVCVISTLSVSKTLPQRTDPPPCTKPAFLAPSKWLRDKTKYLDAQDYKAAQLYPESFVVSSALDELIGRILDDFVSSWYSKISIKPTFVHEVDRNIRIALLDVADKLRKQDTITVVVSRLLPIITTHLKEFDAAENHVRGKSRHATESEELNLAVASKYRDGRLHPAVALQQADTKVSQQEYLRGLVMRVMPDLVSESMLKSRTVFVLIKELVSCAILSPVVQFLSDPDTWNQIIESYGKTMLQDRKTVRRMRAALDEHTSPRPQKQSPAELPRLGPHDSQRSFERFIRAIQKTKTLSDARRFRSQIASQLAKESLVEAQDPIYPRRLEMGKRVLEQKISKFTKDEFSSQPWKESDEMTIDNSTKSRELTLTEVLHTASGLSYFMEYMDRQNKVSLVQFWIVVDGFRSPLEDDFGDNGSGTQNVSWTDTDRLDIAQIFETYVSKPELKVPRESQDAVRSFLVAGRKATPEQYRAARTVILAAQSAILDELKDEHYSLFKKSDLFFKFLASDDARAREVHLDAGKDNHSETDISSDPNSRPTPLPSQTFASRPPARYQDLRRAALSSHDVKNLASPRQLNDTGDRHPLFDDGYDTDPLAHSTQSLGNESNPEHGQHEQVIESMEAALTDIMTETHIDEIPEKQHKFLVGKEDYNFDTPRTQHGAQGPSEVLEANAASKDKPRPSLTTLGLVNTYSRIGVFSDNDLFSHEEKFIEDEYADQNTGKIDTEDEIHAAAPGDLGLAEAITALTNNIERLVSQESVVEALTRKAELTNNAAELRILKKSRDSLQREIKRKELQRQQYIVQESDNSLYGRSSVRIKSVMVGKEDDGREFALYVVEVQRRAGEQMAAATWAVAHRYSEFHDLHQRLRRTYPSTRNLEFPRRRMVMKLQKHFLDNRRLALEAYLQQLLRMSDVCRSRELRSFLSQQAILSEKQTSAGSDSQDIVTRIYNSVTDGMDEFLGNIAVLDQLTVAGQNLVSAATGQTSTSSPGIVSIERSSVAEAEAELQAFEDKELEPLVKPVCDIFLEIFELNRDNNWLRGRAVVVILHQLLGGAIERRIRDGFNGILKEDSLVRSITKAKETIWPSHLSGVRSAMPQRSLAQKQESRKAAGLVLTSLLPDLAASVVGRTNAQSAARRITSVINNRRLNEHLAMTLLDEIFAVLFGPLVTQNQITQNLRD